MATYTGHEAIERAERLSDRRCRLRKYADPVEGARDWLTPDEAREIAAEDPGLIYLRVPGVQPSDQTRSERHAERYASDPEYRKRRNQIVASYRKRRYHADPQFRRKTLDASLDYQSRRGPKRGHSDT